MDLVRALGLAGIRSAVVAPPGGTAAFSRYAYTTIDPAGPPALLDALLAFARSQSERPVLFYAADKDATFLADNFERLSSAFRFVFPEVSLVRTLLDKRRFHEMAERLGLPVPRTRVARPSTEDPPPELPFPVVLKPVPYRDRRWDLATGGRKVAVFDTAEDLAREWPALAAIGASVLIQELVPGPESEIVSYHAYIDAAGETVGEFTGRKLRTYPLEHGHSTALTTTNDSTVLDAGREVLERVGLRGVAKVDFKRAPDGRLHLLEVNPRFSLWAHLGAVAGVNLPALVYGDLTGAVRPKVSPARPGVTWCRLRDLAAARKDGIGALRWLAWATSCEANSAGFGWDDPLPFFRSRAWRLAHRRGLSPRSATSGSDRPAHGPL